MSDKFEPGRLFMFFGEVVEITAHPRVWVKYVHNDEQPFDTRLSNLVPMDQNKEETGWRDIASAPKDGTTILLYQAKPHINPADENRYWRYEPEKHIMETGYFGSNEYERNVWCLYGYHSDEGPRVFKPTHWMPLPLVPTEFAKPDGE